MADEADRTSINVSKDFAKQLKIIADHHDLTMGEALERFAGGISREYAKVIRQLHAEANPVSVGGES